MDTQQGPTIQHKELCSVLCVSLDGRGVQGRMNTCTCMVESLCFCPPKTITTLLIGYTPTQNVLCVVAQLCPTLCNPMDCSYGFSRQEYWSGLSCPPPGHLPNPGIKPRSPTLQVESLLSLLSGEAPNTK